MKAQILEELIKGLWGSKALLRLILARVVKAITGSLILALLFCLVLLGNYAWLFLLIGAISGLVIFWALRFFGNRFEDSHNKELYSGSLEVKKLAEPEGAKPKVR